MVSVRDADGRSFSTVAAGIMIAEGSVRFPLPWNSTLILLLARRTAGPIEIVHPSTAQPGISRSITEPAPHRRHIFRLRSRGGGYHLLGDGPVPQAVGRLSRRGPADFVQLHEQQIGRAACRVRV